MTRWLRIALVAQLAFFAAWGGRLLTSHRDVAVVWLATEPVDPRDLLSGHYVALRYPIGTGSRALCERLPRDAVARPVWVQLATGEDTVVTAEGVTSLFEPVRCVTAAPPPGSGIWMRGILDADDHVTYGIERMYVAETSPLREARSGSVVAKVGVNEVYEARLLGLVTQHGPTATPAEEP